MKLILRTIFVIMFFFFYFQGISYGQNLSGTIDNSKTTIEKENNEVKVENQNKGSSLSQTLEFLENRKKNIENTLGTNKEEEFEKKLKELNDKINLNHTDQEVKNQLINDLTKKFESINDSLKSKNEEIKELTKFISSQEGNRDKLILKKNELEKETVRLNKQKDELNKDLELERQKLVILRTDIEELQIYKAKYEQLVKERNEKRSKESFHHLMTYLISTLIFIVSSWIGLKLSKNIHIKSIFSVSITLLFILFLVTYSLVINPGLVIIFVFIASSLVIVFKEILVSIMSSVLIIKRFKVGDLIEVKGMKGVINSIGPLNVIIETLDKEIISIGNYLLIAEPTKIHQDARLREYVDLELHLSIDEFDEIFKGIIKICKNLDKNFSKHGDITYIMKEKVSGKLGVNMRIKTIQSGDLLLRIFHEYLKNRNVELVELKSTQIDENGNEKEET